MVKQWNIKSTDIRAYYNLSINNLFINLGNGRRIGNTSGFSANVKERDQILKAINKGAFIACQHPFFLRINPPHPSPFCSKGRAHDHAQSSHSYTFPRSRHRKQARPMRILLDISI